MKNKSKIDRLVEETLNSVSEIENSAPPPFFKDMVLKKMARKETEKEHGVYYSNWLTISYQAAILVALVVLNLLALLSNTTDDKYVENVKNFATVYGLSEMDKDAYPYEN